MKSQIHELKNLITKKMSKNQIIKTAIFILVVILTFACKKENLPKPESKFSVLNDSIIGVGEVDYTFQFINNTNYATTYRWDFAGGMTSTEKDPTVTLERRNFEFTNSGSTYDYYRMLVKLNAFNGKDSSSTSKYIYIRYDS